MGRFYIKKEHCRVIDIARHIIKLLIVLWRSEEFCVVIDTSVHQPFGKHINFQSIYVYKN